MTYQMNFDDPTEQAITWKRFGIRAWSPTQANSWLASPGLYVRRYIGKYKEEESPAFWRGSAVEDGWKALLCGAGMHDALIVANLTFQRRLEKNRAPAFRTSDDITKELRLIEPMLVQASQWSAPPERPDTQIKIVLNLDGLTIPIEGYLDFAFAKIDVDCKTSTRISNEISEEHARQVAVYRKARGRRGGLLYITPAKHNFLELSDERMEQALRDVRDAAESLHHFLAGCPTREEAIRRLPVDYGHWTQPTRISPAQVIAHMRGVLANASTFRG